MQQLRHAFTKNATELLALLYPIDEEWREQLSPSQLIPFNGMLAALKGRLTLEGYDQEVLELHYDGITQPLPFPDLHWELAICWMLVDGTIPSSITLKDGQCIDYTSSLLRDAKGMDGWRKKLAYAKTGFRAR